MYWRLSRQRSGCAVVLRTVEIGLDAPPRWQMLGLPNTCFRRSSTDRLQLSFDLPAKQWPAAVQPVQRHAAGRFCGFDEAELLGQRSLNEAACPTGRRR
jgi:hypothetical protein